MLKGNEQEIVEFCSKSGMSGICSEPDDLSYSGRRFIFSIKGAGFFYGNEESEVIKAVPISQKLYEELTEIFIHEE